MPICINRRGSYLREPYKQPNGRADVILSAITVPYRAVLRPGIIGCTSLESLLEGPTQTLHIYRTGIYLDQYVTTEAFWPPKKELVRKRKSLEFSSWFQPVYQLNYLIPAVLFSRLLERERKWAFRALQIHLSLMMVYERYTWDCKP